jgi:hypothetical protein
VVCNLIQRKLAAKKVDSIIEKKNDKVFSGFHLTQQEHAFILRGLYPESYIKFILREEWYEKMFKNVSTHFSKDKSLPTKQERSHSYWKNIYGFCKTLI